MSKVKHIIYLQFTLQILYFYLEGTTRLGMVPLIR